ncbi:MULTISPECIES: ABC transporter permease [Gordonia]|uniref:ABC transporter permease n=1 Tax=Gordonia TaxID=2053 RepID=UPI001FEB0A4A|nr:MULTISPECIES: ABC transporter permease [Gordonia]
MIAPHRHPEAEAADRTAVSGDAPTAGGVRAFIRRDLALLRRNSASLISMFVVPPLFLLCLVGVFGYSAEESGVDYLRYMLAGCIFQAGMFTSSASAMAVAHDVESGILDRVRLVPGALAGFLTGRLVVDMVRMTASTVTLFIVARLCGLSLRWSEYGLTLLWGLVAALVLCLITDGWIVLLDKPVAAAASVQSFEMLLFLCSTAFIPAIALSGALRAVIEHMPFSPIIAVIRNVLTHELSRGGTIEAMTWIVALGSVGIALIVKRFSGRSAT